MNELTITPNLEMKSARIRGRCAAGEHVRVRLVGMATLSSETTRLCVVLRERLFAVFPLADGDNATEWTVDGNDLTCVLNLNTEPLVKFARVGALTLEFILDDPSNNILYFSEMHEIMPWHSLRANGDDAKPRDTPPFDGVVVSTKTLVELREAVRRLAEKGGAKVIGSVALALLSVRVAFAATVQTAPLNELDLDSNPSVVTNVTLDGLATTEEVASVDVRVDGQDVAIESNRVNIASNRVAISTLSDTKLDKSGGTVMGGIYFGAQGTYGYLGLAYDGENHRLIITDGWHENLAYLEVPNAYDGDRVAFTHDIPTVPTNVSAFNNDAGYLTGYTESDPTIKPWAKANTKPTYTASEVGAIPTTGGVFNASLHLNQKLSVGTWTSSVKPYDISGGSGIAFVFGDNVQTKQSNTMTLGVGALNTNAWSFIWNGDADRMYIPGFPAMSNPYATRHNGGFHVNPSVRFGMVNPLQNFWIGDTNLNDWISALAPTPTWDTLSGKPTTISGYGITDALKSDFASLTNNAAFTLAVAAVSPPTDTSELEARGFVRIVADDEIYFVTITTTQTEE